MNVEILREICLKLPAVTEDVKWGADLCFCVGEKMFCVTGLNAEKFGASFKASTEDFELLIERSGITPAKYLARYKWVYVTGSEPLSQEEWEHFINLSYQMVVTKLTKKVREKEGLN
jgi:predicted DNA-binding protein (MmcQ/YjbR family)